MKSPRPRPRRPRHPTAREDTGPRRVAPDASLGALQAKAQDSTPVRQLHALQRKAAGVVQREVVKSGAPDWAQKDYVDKVGKTGTVDTSPGPRMPDYGPNETPSWQKNDPTGVPKWAKDEYKAHSKVTLIASVKDGKIGSIYFANGRIRTTHGDGPELERDEPTENTRRFNLDQEKAFDLFLTRNRGIYELFYAQTDTSLSKEQREEVAAMMLYQQYSQWLAVYLKLAPLDQLPDWVTEVTGPDDAFDTSAANPPDNITLFEIFTKVSNGKVQSWHPSRGIAAKFETNKQVVSVLMAALKHIDGVTDINQRNTMFYAFIKSRLPDFAKQIRKPDEV
ncbi:hypothetical protein [Roseobacter sp. A03A-229]